MCGVACVLRAVQIKLRPSPPSSCHRWESCWFSREVFIFNFKKCIIGFNVDKTVILELTTALGHRLLLGTCWLGSLTLLSGDQTDKFMKCFMFIILIRYSLAEPLHFMKGSTLILSKISRIVNPVKTLCLTWLAPQHQYILRFYIEF